MSTILRFKKRALILVFLLIIQLTMSFHVFSTSDPLETYNAFDDYATGTQTGVWSYQEMSGGVYTNLGWDTANTMWHTNAYVSTNQDIFMTGQNTVWFHPGAGIDSVVTFTAPKSGTITIKSASGNGVAIADNSGDGIVFTIKNGDTNLFAPTVITKDNRVATGNNIDFNLTATVNIGDKIHFIVGMNGNNAGDATFVTPLIAYTEATEQTYYNARTDYTTSTQTGVWNYQERAGGLYTNLAWDATNSFWHTNAYVSTNTDIYMTGQDTMWFHPGVNVDSVVTFTAPTSGTITIKSATGLGVAVSDDSGDGIVFSIRNGNTDLFAPTVITKSNRIVNGNNIDFDITATVTVGDKIHFIVGMNGNNSGDATYLTPVITYTSEDVDSGELVFIPGSKIDVTNITKKGFDISWTAAQTSLQSEISYTVYVSESPILQIPSETGILTGTTCTYTFTGLTMGKSYYVAVVARNTNGNETLLTRDEKITTIYPTYNARIDYTTAVQSGVWNYQELAGGIYTNLAWDATGLNWHTNAYVSTNTDIYMTGQDTMWFHPSVMEDSVVTFNAPYTGEITIKSASGNGIAISDDSGDGIVFTIKNGLTNLLAPTVVTKSNRVANGNNIDFNITTTVNAGDKIHFIVGKNGDNGGDATYVTPLITYTSVESGSGELFFIPGSKIEATSITKTGFIINWPFAQSSVQSAINYTVYISGTPIVQIPSSGGISTGANCTYTFTNLDIGQNYYVAVVAKNQNSNETNLIRSEKITTVFPTYNAYEDYTKKTQSSGVWQYQVGYSQGADFVTENHKWNTEAGYWGSAEASLINVATSDMVTGKPSIVVHPGANNRDAVIAFIAPYTGTIEISMANGGIFAPLNGAAQSNDGINFKLLKGTKALYTKDAISSNNSNPEDVRCFANTLTVQIQKGEKLSFIVNSNKTTDNDSTYFNPFIKYTQMLQKSPNTSDISVALPYMISIISLSLILSILFTLRRKKI